MSIAAQKTGEAHPISYSNLTRAWPTTAQNMQRGQVYKVCGRLSAGEDKTVKVSFKLRTHWGNEQEEPRTYAPLQSLKASLGEVQADIKSAPTQEINLRADERNQFVIEDWKEEPCV